MKKIYSIQRIIIIAIIFLSIISFLILPDNVAVQWNYIGTSNYIPKIYAILIPAVISLFGIISWKYSSLRYSKNIEISKKLQTIHSVIWGTISCTGIIISILFMLMNGKPVIL